MDGLLVALLIIGIIIVIAIIVAIVIFSRRSTNGGSTNGTEGSITVTNSNGNVQSCGYYCSRNINKSVTAKQPNWTGARCLKASRKDSTPQETPWPCSALRLGTDTLTCYCVEDTDIPFGPDDGEALNAAWTIP